MTIEALKMAKLSPATAGYLAIYIKLADIFGELSDTTAKIYDDVNVDKINNACFNALTTAQDEVMKLFVNSVEENICSRSTIRKYDDL